MTVSTNHDDFNRGLPVIAGVEITTDAHGRFNLNALHRASGEGKHKAPNEWLRAQQAQDLIAELEAQTGNSRFENQSKDSGFGVLNVIRGGNAPGTFAAEEAAVAYAAWISPSFHVTVLRTFIAYRKGELTGTERIAPASSTALSREVRLQTKMFAKLAKDMGLEGNQAILSVCRGVESMIGINPMAAMGVKRIEAEQNDDLLNVRW